MAQFRRLTAKDFRMVQFPDGIRYQSPINRITYRHPFTTNPARVALMTSDFEAIGEGIYHLSYSTAAFIYEGGKRLQQYLLAAATGYNWESGVPLDPHINIDPDRYAQLQLHMCPPPFFPPMFLEYNILLLPGSRHYITTNVEMFQDRMLQMEVWIKFAKIRSRDLKADRWQVEWNWSAGFDDDWKEHAFAEIPIPADWSLEDRIRDQIRALRVTDLFPLLGIPVPVPQPAPTPEHFPTVDPRFLGRHLNHNVFIPYIPNPGTSVDYGGRSPSPMSINSSSSDSSDNSESYHVHTPGNTTPATSRQATPNSLPGLVPEVFD